MAKENISKELRQQIRQAPEKVRGALAVGASIVAKERADKAAAEDTLAKLEKDPLSVTPDQLAHAARVVGRLIGQ
jgi:hypothetical protein